MKRKTVFLLFFFFLLTCSCSKRIFGPHYKAVAAPKERMFSRKIKKIEHKVIRIEIKRRFFGRDVLIIKETKSKKHPAGSIPCK